MEKVLIALVYEKNREEWSPDEIACELEACVRACGGIVIERIACPLVKPNPAYLIGEGKVAEIAELCASGAVDTVVFSRNLKGSQQRNLEDRLEVKTIDHTQLILDIFARRAFSQEGQMQVELAQLEYLLPRLVGKGIVLSRLGGGIGTSGPGETKLEIDRRRIGQRIAKLKRGLQEVEKNRALGRQRRKKGGIPLISIIGYTNAGKSTLLNALTEAKQEIRDGLFTTLDPVSRQYILPNNQKIILADTVGFMHDLPHDLIEAFKATLEEVREADLLLHVLDISHPDYRHLHNAVMDVLDELDAREKNVITVLNKIDRVTDPNIIERAAHHFAKTVAISAREGLNFDALAQKIVIELSPRNTDIEIVLPLKRMDLVSMAHNEGQVYSVKYYNDSIYLRASLPNHLIGLFEKERIRGRSPG